MTHPILFLHSRSGAVLFIMALIFCSISFQAHATSLSDLQDSQISCPRLDQDSHTALSITKYSYDGEDALKQALADCEEQYLKLKIEQSLENSDNKEKCDKPKNADGKRICRYESDLKNDACTPTLVTEFFGTGPISSEDTLAKGTLCTYDANSDGFKKDKNGVWKLHEGQCKKVNNHPIEDDTSMANVFGSFDWTDYQCTKKNSPSTPKKLRK